MRIVKAVATDIHTNEKQVFTFGNSSEGKLAVTTRGGRLNNYFEFCFGDAECMRDVEIEFLVNGDLFSLSKIHGDDGIRTVLKKMTDGHYQVVARTHALEFLEELLGAKFADILPMSYVNNSEVESFHGDLRVFDEIRLLKEVQDSIRRSNAEAVALRDSAVRRVKEYSAGEAPTTDSLDELNAELDLLGRDITVATAQLGELKAKQNVDSIRTDITRQLNDAQERYNKLIARQDDIEEARARIKLRDEAEILIPKLRTLKAIAEQRSEYEKRRFEITGELEWQENELASVNQQLEEKERQYALTQDKRNRIEGINAELSYIASLYEKNKQLNEELVELNEKYERLSSEKALYVSRMEQVESQITEARQSLDAFQIPARSVGELLEAVRVDVKIDEVGAQIEKLQSEIAVKESQIAEKESSLVVQVKRFRAVAELDSAVSPIKAKDTILQVLDTKYSKLESVNISLKEKLRNFERALEDYKFRLIQLEQSRSRLEAEKQKVLLKKQEEFKREVFLNSQKVFSDDASSVFAVTVSFNDAEIQALDSEIEARNLDRDLIMERAYGLDGAIKEIKRHIEINSAEMETLSREKENINKRYNEIVSQNTSEAVVNYLKALSSDNGTKYLLDVQQDAVRCEAELSELKRSAESLRAKQTALKNRLKYLKETQEQLDDTHTSVDELISTNDRIKDELSDIGERLTSGYEQYKALVRQAENIESRMDDIRGAIIETEKTIKVNERQIAESTAKAQRYAGSDDLEQAVADLRYELGDVESERQMLKDSKKTMEKEIFKKRLELEKTQWLYESKNREYDELYRELQTECNIKGLDVEKISSIDTESDLDGLRQVIAEFDALRQSLSEKIDNLLLILKNQPAPEVSASEIADKEREIAILQDRQRELEQKRNELLEQYVKASKERAKVSVAAAEARTLNSLKETISHNEIVSLLISDKIRTILFIAERYLDALGTGNIKLHCEDCVLSVTVNGEEHAFDELDAKLKTAVYIALVISMPNTATSDGKWMIFEEKINIDSKSLSALLWSSSDISYVTDFAQE